MQLNKQRNGGKPTSVATEHAAGQYGEGVTALADVSGESLTASLAL